MKTNKAVSAGDARVNVERNLGVAAFFAKVVIFGQEGFVFVGNIIKPWVFEFLENLCLNKCASGASAADWQAEDAIIALLD